MKEEKITNKVRRLKKEAKAYREPKEADIKENRRFYKGDQWKYSQNRPVKNWCFSIVEGECPILTDSLSWPSFVALDGDKQEAAKMLDSAVKHVCLDQDFELKKPASIKNSLIDGPSWQFVDYDPDGDNGEGEITVRIVPWQFVWIDPTANDIQAAKYAIVEEPIRIEELKRLYPKHADKLQTANIKDESDSEKHYADPKRYYPGEEDGAKSRYDGSSMTVYTKTWTKDYSTEKIPEEEIVEAVESEIDAVLSATSPFIQKYQDHQAHIIALSQVLDEIAPQVEAAQMQMQQGIEVDETIFIIPEIIQNSIETHQIYLEENPKATRPKFKNFWRLTITANDDKIVLYDGAPDVDDGMIPLVPYYCYKEDDCYGMSEIQNVKDAQKSFNDMDYSEYKGLRLVSNPGWIKDENSGVDSESLTNEEGIVVTKNPGTEVRRLEPGTVSVQLDIRKQGDKRAIENISGVNEISQGVKPKGVSAASAIQSLAQQSIGRMRQKSRYLEYHTLPRLARLIGSRVVKYWTSERKIRSQEGGAAYQFIDFSPEEVRELEYDVIPVAGSIAGIDKDSIYGLYTELLDKGQIDIKTYLEVVDIPQGKKVLERLTEMDETNAMLEQLAAENAEMKEALGLTDEQAPVE